MQHAVLDRAWLAALVAASAAWRRLTGKDHCGRLLRQMPCFVLESTSSSAMVFGEKSNGLTFFMQGAYRDNNGKPVVLNCVREAERRVCGHNFME